MTLFLGHALLFFILYLWVSWVFGTVYDSHVFIKNEKEKEKVVVSREYTCFLLFGEIDPCQHLILWLVKKMLGEIDMSTSSSPLNFIL